MLSFLGLLADENDRMELGDLYVEHGQFCLRYARSRLRDPSMAEDIVHEAFCALARNFETISGKPCDEKKAYLVTALRNKCRDFNKAEKRYKYMGEFSEELLPLDRLRSEELSQQDIRTDAMIAAELISKLPDLYRSVVENRLMWGWSNKEVAMELGITEDNCAKRYERGRKKLVELLIKEGVQL